MKGCVNLLVSFYCGYYILISVSFLFLCFLPSWFVRLFLPSILPSFILLSFVSFFPSFVLSFFYSFRLFNPPVFSRHHHVLAAILDHKNLIVFFKNSLRHCTRKYIFLSFQSYFEFEIESYIQIITPNKSEKLGCILSAYMASQETTCEKEA